MASVRSIAKIRDGWSSSESRRQDSVRINSLLLKIAPSICQVMCMLNSSKACCTAFNSSHHLGTLSGVPRREMSRDQAYSYFEPITQPPSPFQVTHRGTSKDHSFSCII